MKQCFKCKVKQPLSEFYRHAQMADGHLNKCKTCTKSDVGKHRSENLDRIREYDRDRGARTPPGYQKEYYARFPNKMRAHRKVAYAIKRGYLVEEPCGECARTENVHAHHDDYSKPLNIRWLCPVCHKAWHLVNGEAPNG